MKANAPDEVVVTLDGTPRPAVVVARDGERVRVRFRQAGGFEERWVPISSVLTVEPGRPRPPVLKLVGLVTGGAAGLALLLYPGGSDRRLADSVRSPTPSPSSTATATPAARADAQVGASARPTPTAGSRGRVTAVMFGDSLFTGRGLAPGQPTLAQVATRLLGWDTTILGGDGTGFTTGGRRGGQPYAVRLSRVTTAPRVLLVEGGASDTSATPEQLTKAAGAFLERLARRFPTTTVVLLGPVAVEQPPDGQLVRVGKVLAAAAAAHRIRYLDPIALGWINTSNAGGFRSASGFYPNAAGHAFLGRKLAAALRQVTAR